MSWRGVPLLGVAFLGAGRVARAQTQSAGSKSEAVAGTAIGAVAGDIGRGAAVGATAGLLRRARESRVAAEASENQAVATIAAQAQAASQQQRQTFGRAFGACLDGRGYTVR